MGNCIIKKFIKLMQKNSLILIVIIVFVQFVSCKTSRIDSSKTPQIDLPITDFEMKEVSIYLPSKSSMVDYELWIDFFNQNYGTKLKIDTYSKSKLDLDNDDLYYQPDCAYGFFPPADAPKDSFKGVYLYTQWGYHVLIHSQLKWIERENREAKEKLSIQDDGSFVGNPFNNLDVVNLFDTFMLEPYTDNEGNIWAIPYEHRYPEVKVRKYNEEVLNNLNEKPPNTLDELHALLLKVQKNNDYLNVLPSMKIDNVFSGFEDIVNAFGLSIIPGANSFYSIQYDEEIKKFRDFAFTPQMEDCINFFTLLINEGLIDLDNKVYSSNDNFYTNSIFSVYDVIDHKDDLNVPYTRQFYSTNYTSHQFYLPTRYLYVLGKGLEVDESLNAVLNALYVNDESSLVARFGIEENFYKHKNEISISIENYLRAPKLIGSFPFQDYKLNVNTSLDKLQKKIESENIESGYYKACGPDRISLKVLCDIRFYNDEGKSIDLEILNLAELFYNMLGMHFYDKNRPSTEQFLENYRMAAKKILDKDNLDRYFGPDGRVPMDIEY